MNTKEIKITVPEDYEIDKIVFKKVDKVIIKWTSSVNAVEVKADGEHFLLDAGNPTAFCNWEDANRYCKYIDSCAIFQLPTIKQLKVIVKHLNKINKVIKENSGFQLQGYWYWSCEEKDKFCAWLVGMLSGNTSIDFKLGSSYVRAVSAL